MIDLDHNLDRVREARHHALLAGAWRFIREKPAGRRAA